MSQLSFVVYMYGDPYPVIRRTIYILFLEIDLELDKASKQHLIQSKHRSLSMHTCIRTSWTTLYTLFKGSLIALTYLLSESCPSRLFGVWGRKAGGSPRFPRWSALALRLLKIAWSSAALCVLYWRKINIGWASRRYQREKGNMIYNGKIT